MDTERIERRASFDSVAELYDAARPGYPDALYDDLIALAGLKPGASLLEIGSGTGHATVGFARRGFPIDCIELGEQMARVARDRLARFPAVRITVADFDHWSAERSYGLVFSASAYHWLNPGTRVERVAQLLEPRGWIAIWRNHHVRSQADEYFNRAAGRIYAQLAPSIDGLESLPSIDGIPLPELEEWRGSGLFEDAGTRVYTWQKEYTAAEYVRMLDTHSNHRILPESERERLFEGLVDLIETRFSGKVSSEYATVVLAARKRL
jgi:trans-aconitate methyltransferase